MALTGAEKLLIKACKTRPYCNRCNYIDRRICDGFKNKYGVLPCDYKKEGLRDE